MLRRMRIVFVFVTVTFIFGLAHAQQPNTDAMRWRYIGPVEIGRAHV